MSESEFTEIKQEPKKENKKYSGKKKFSVGNAVFGVLKGNLLSQEFALEYLPFIFYISFLLLIYIGNNYNSVKTVMKISSINKELKELRYEYITTTSELMHVTRRSVIAKKNDLIIKGIKDSKSSKDSLAPLYKIYKDN